MRHTTRSTRGVLLVILALSGLLGFALPSPAVGSPTAPLDLIPRAYLPLVMRPEEPDLAIYDKHGTLQDWDWLVDTFGDVPLDRGTGTASVVELREVEGPSTLVLWLENANGEPIVGQEVVFYWPDAPELKEPHQQACGLNQGVIGYTKENGEVGFGMGDGAWYDPDAGEIGPHQVWIVTEGTDCLRGMGMILLTDHVHLDSVWRLP